MKDKIIAIICGALVGWLIISQVIFAIRHPWLTDTERLLNFHNAVLFHTVDRFEENQ